MSSTQQRRRDTDRHTDARDRRTRWMAHTGDETDARDGWHTQETNSIDETLNMFKGVNTFNMLKGVNTLEGVKRR